MLPVEIMMNSVESSNIDAIGYNLDAKMLEIRFKNNSSYRYKEVPLEIHAALMKAPSKGVFIAKHIKGKFEAARTDSPQMVKVETEIK